MYIYVYVCVCIYVCVCVYVYIELTRYIYRVTRDDGTSWITIISISMISIIIEHVTVEHESHRPGFVPLDRNTHPPGRGIWKGGNA